MKTLKYLSSAIILVTSIQLFAQAPLKTDSVKVSGNCGMCKARIEKAAKIDGVDNVSWDKTTKILTVSYDPQKTSVLNVEKKIAEAGHDTKDVKAKDEVYQKLPGCCQYR